MENENFQNSFINIYCDMLNTVLLPEFLTTRLDSISGNIEEMIPLRRCAGLILLQTGKID